MSINLPAYQVSFIGGEIGARAQGRTDLNWAGKSADLIENGVVLLQGGVQIRGGMRYVAKLSDNELSDAITLMPMFFSEGDGAVVSVYEDALRIYDLTGTPLFVNIDAGAWGRWSLHNGDFAFGNEGMVIVGENIPPILVRRLSDAFWQRQHLFITNIPTRVFTLGEINSDRDTIYEVDFSNLPKDLNGDYYPITIFFGAVGTGSATERVSVNNIEFQSEQTKTEKTAYSDIVLTINAGKVSIQHFRWKYEQPAVVADNVPTDTFIASLQAGLDSISLSENISFKADKTFTSREIFITQSLQYQYPSLNDRWREWDYTPNHTFPTSLLPVVREHATDIRSVAPFKVRITIQGQTNENRVGALLVEDKNGSAVPVVVIQSSTSPSSAEAIWNDARGYLRGVAYDNQRLVVASPVSSPLRAIFSKTIVDDLDPISFALTTTVGKGDKSTQEALADNGFSIKFESDDQSPIVDLFSGDALFAYTQTGVFTVEGEKNPVDRFVVKHTDSYGMYAGSIAVSIDGSPHHITTKQDDIRRLLFSRQTQRFESQSISQGNPERIAGVKGLSAQAESPYSDTRLLHGWKEDGTGFFCSLSRENSMAAFSGLSTQGKILAMVSVGQQTFAAVYYKGAGTLLVEMDTACPFDNCHILTADDENIPQTKWVLPQELHALLDADGNRPPLHVFAEGNDRGAGAVSEEQKTDADGNAYTEYSIATAQPHARIEVGLPFSFEVRSQRINIDTQRDYSRATHKTPNGVFFDFLETNIEGVEYGVQIGENDPEWKAVALDYGSLVPDTGAPLFTGRKNAPDPLSGNAVDVRICIRRQNAGKITLRAIYGSIAVSPT